jgi:hypothetical protein
VEGSLRLGVNFLCFKYIPVFGFPWAIFTSFSAGAVLGYAFAIAAWETSEVAINKLRDQKEQRVTG